MVVRDMDGQVQVLLRDEEEDNFMSPERTANEAERKREKRKENKGFKD